MAAADLEYRCFVGGLAWTTDDRSLADAFRYFGEVVDSKVINDRETGRSRGFGFVTFSDEQAMTDAIESMNGKELDGRNITVNQAQARSGGGDGGYRGSNGGGGSRYGDRGNYGSRERSDGGNGRYGGSGRAGGYNDANGGGNGGYGGSNRSGGYGGGNNRYASGGSDSQNWRK